MKGTRCLAVLLLCLTLTGCNWTGMPGGSFTNLSNAEVKWLQDEYGYTGGMLTEEMKEAWELRRELNACLYAKYYMEDDYQFLCITELCGKKGALVWAGGRYVFCYKTGTEYMEMTSPDGHMFLTEDNAAFWINELPDSEKYDNWEYRMEIIGQND